MLTIKNYTTKPKQTTRKVKEKQEMPQLDI